MASEKHDTESTGNPPWRAPQLTYRGTVGELLRSGGGKLSIAGSDPGEMRCEKPHADDCVQASQG
jgi:hypothetical protein